MLWPYLKSVKPYTIVKSSFVEEQINSPEYTLVQDLIVLEEPLEIWLKSGQNQSSAKLLFTTMRTPNDDINLVRGWLYSSGAIQDVDDILAINHTGTGRLKKQTTNQVLVTLNTDFDWQAYQRPDVVNSACGVCGQQSIENLLEKLAKRSFHKIAVQKLNKSALLELAEQLRARQTIFAQTGGIHGAALFDEHATMLDVREDVGRHNALDKLIGANLKRLSGNTKVAFGIVLSGRVSFELVQKAAMANIRYIVAMGAPSSLAIEIAKDCDICLIGFVKSSGFNCYFGWDSLQ